MTVPKQRHYESAQEEFQRRVKELYELAEKMGLRLTVSVKRKTEPETRNLPPLPKREPGEN